MTNRTIPILIGRLQEIMSRNHANDPRRDALEEKRQDDYADAMEKVRRAWWDRRLAPNQYEFVKIVTPR